MSTYLQTHSKTIKQVAECAAGNRERVPDTRSQDCWLRSREHKQISRGEKNRRNQTIGQYVTSHSVTETNLFITGKLPRNTLPYPSASAAKGQTQPVVLAEQ